MDSACIRHTDLPGTSKLFADFAYHFDRVSGFYKYDPHDGASFAAAAREVEYPDERRAAMTAALHAQNGPSESLDRFAQPGTVAVVTGQQVGLFSGPAYTIYKALTAARLAATLNERGIPAVPVFWLATEDHDFEEVNHAWAFGQDRQPVAVKVERPASRRPVGGTVVENPPVDELARLLAGFPHADEVIAAVKKAYPSGTTMGAGFKALLVELLGRYGFLFLDPLDPAIRSIAAPFMAKALEQAPELKKQVQQRSRELEAAGYHAQVHLEDKTSLFFSLEKGERVPLRNGANPESISPNALLRPVMQDYLLPTVTYIGGPAELAYLAQSRVLYEQLLGRMPVVMSRAGFTLLEPRAVKLLARYRASVTDTFVDQELLKDRIALSLIPPSLERAFTDAAAGMDRNLESLVGELNNFDPTLAASLEKSRAKIQFQFTKAHGKVARERMRRDERAAAEAQYLSGLLYPKKHLQERFYSILPFLAAHGMDLVDRVYDAVQLECPDHRVLSI